MSEGILRKQWKFDRIIWEQGGHDSYKIDQTSNSKHEIWATLIQ